MVKIQIPELVSVDTLLWLIPGDFRFLINEEKLRLNYLNDYTV